MVIADAGFWGGDGSKVTLADGAGLRGAKMSQDHRIIARNGDEECLSFRVQGAGRGVEGVGCRVQGIARGIQGVDRGVQVAGRGVQGVGRGIQGRRSRSPRCRPPGSRCRWQDPRCRRRIELLFQVLVWRDWRNDWRWSRRRRLRAIDAPCRRGAECRTFACPSNCESP